MTTLSKTVADRLVFGDQVMQAIAVQQDAVLSALIQRAPRKPPRDLALAPVVSWLGSLLSSAAEALRETDLAHNAELADDATHRQAREDATAALRSLLMNGRSVVSGAYGEGFAAAVGLTSAIATRPDQVITYGSTVVRLLRKERTPRVVMPGIEVDLRALADEIEARVAALRAALGDVQREEREAQTTLSRRDAALETYVRTYAGVSEIFSGLCTLAGLDDLADKVRPTARRRAGIPDEPAEPVTPPEPADPAAPPSTDDPL